MSGKILLWVFAFVFIMLWRVNTHKEAPKTDFEQTVGTIIGIKEKGDLSRFIIQYKIDGKDELANSVNYRGKIDLVKYGGGKEVEISYRKANPQVVIIEADDLERAFEDKEEKPYKGILYLVIGLVLLAAAIGLEVHQYLG
ncbi:MAG: hypothetical protein UHN88_01545 [Eubacterium sp.]|nr:hypothetical protein [Eubacterium sp.]